MSTRLFLGDAPIDAIPLDNRAFAYGESLFETLRAHRGELPWWDRHLARLRAAAERLAMPLPDAARILAEAQRLLGGDDAVLKLHVSRSGARGYAPDHAAAPLWLLSKQPLPAPHDALNVIHCETRLSAQPRLAGLKHGNRLEQVLARSEAAAQGADEGLMCDAEGAPICATSANLFALIDGVWRTPAVERCGVAGVMRGWLLAQSLAIIAPITQTELQQAEAVFLSNAVRGILPVRRLGDTHWPSIHSAIRDLQAQLAVAHPGFTPYSETKLK
ncbi:MAG: aminodeoxychorismate lyase [Pseudomonadota bacterium]|nr:aminodeoxychorismate lyase [Pseudomonadota bacterium]